MSHLDLLSREELLAEARRHGVPHPEAESSARLRALLRARSLRGHANLDEAPSVTSKALRVAKAVARRAQSVLRQGTTRTQQVLWQGTMKTVDLARSVSSWPPPSKRDLARRKQPITEAEPVFRVSTRSEPSVAGGKSVEVAPPSGGEHATRDRAAEPAPRLSLTKFAPSAYEASWEVGGRAIARAERLLGASGTLTVRWLVSAFDSSVGRVHSVTHDFAAPDAIGTQRFDPAERDGLITVAVGLLGGSRFVSLQHVGPEPISAIEPGNESKGEPRHAKPSARSTLETTDET